jgi:hypothetical protein
MFSLGNIQRTRFLLPAYPLVSALYAALLVKIVSQDKGLSSAILQHIKRIVLAACFVFGLCLVLAGIFIDMRLVAGGILTIFAVAVLYATLFRRNNIYGLVMISLCIILIFSVAENFMSRVIYEPLSSRVVDKIREHTRGPIEIAAGGLDSDYYSQIYVLSGGLITVYTLQPNMNLNKLREFQFIVLSELSNEYFPLEGYSVYECGYSYKRKHFQVRSLWNIRTVGDLRSLISEQKEHYYLFTKSESSRH